MLLQFYYWLYENFIMRLMIAMQVVAGRMERTYEADTSNSFFPLLIGERGSQQLEDIGSKQNEQPERNRLYEKRRIKRRSNIHVIEMASHMHVNICTSANFRFLFVLISIAPMLSSTLGFSKGKGKLLSLSCFCQLELWEDKRRSNSVLMDD